MIRSRVVVVGALVSSACALGLWARSAQACGGCFSPPETVTTVDAHRMAIALSSTRTILWDQIRYSGDPEDFVWVLPVPTPEATIDVADDEFFAELERETAVRVVPPPLPPPPVCPPPPGSAGGGLDAGPAPAADAGVDVHREEVVGPYEVVVIGSEDAGALLAWLNEHGYAVPEANRPVVQRYADAGNEFIVLRLAPDQGVDAMQPVRVAYPGYMGTFPLEMVTVGAYGTLSLTLWVIAEQRYEAQNYPTIEIDRDNLIWDFAAGRSNYRDLFRRNIDNAGGRGWVVQAAQPLSALFVSSEERLHVEAVVPYPFVTRLETDLLVDHLTEDLQLGPSEDSSTVSNFIQVDRSINDPPPPPDCPDWGADDITVEHSPFSCSVPGGPGGGAFALLVAVLLVFRSRRRVSGAD